jgi:tetratricopeptide (TPR) repeat protein
MNKVGLVQRVAGAGRLLLLLTTPLLGTDTVWAEQSIDEYLTRAQDQYSKGQYAFAVENYSNAIRLWPNDSALYRGRANAYLKLKLYYQALADYSKAIRLYPIAADLYNDRGDAYLELKHYDQAIADYTKYIDLKPDDAFVVCGQSLVSGVLRQYHQAMDYYAAYQRLHPNDALEYFAAYTKRGSAYLALKRYDQAIADYTRAISLNPKDPMAYDRRAAVYDVQGKITYAEEDRKKANGLRPGWSGENAVNQK